MKYRLIELSDLDAQKWDDLDIEPFIHNALNGVLTWDDGNTIGGTMLVKAPDVDPTISVGVSKPIKTHKPEPGSTEWVTKTVNEAIIKTPKDAEKVVRMLDGSPLPNVVTDRRIPPLGSAPRHSVQVCKTHGTPLDDRGRCLIKGCKNG